MDRPGYLWPHIALTVPVVFLISLATGYAAVLASTLVISGGLDSEFEEFDELFARAFLAVAVLCFSVILIRKGIWRKVIAGPKWLRLLAVAGILGMASATLDPLHSISHEYNVIRYWTAGFLTWGGVALIAAAIVRSYSLLYRILAAALGALGLLAAFDELFELHEALGNSMSGQVPSSVPVNSQDLTTLSVAVVGFFCAIVGFLAIRVLDRFPNYRLAPGARLSAKLFIGACLVFLCAMLLDSFDVYLERWMNIALLGLLGEGSRVHSFLDAQDLIIRVSNCLEEFLELGSAALLVACGMVFLLPTREAVD